MLDEKRKQELINRFNKLAEQREIWINKNRYYYEDQARYYRFLFQKGFPSWNLAAVPGIFSTN
jgi:hypothetical protein